ncbi:GIY-YIG nuclease family protein [Palleronia sp. LCG004]|uniref:GIY-YIG nuclease family protein n=1 Tax=Palleronia sp. LCG004 TaxID=3079304 RepID=UPI0029425C27|nr:GIY-YIG nuclease family protein [Palleronia sp. LCG004]WOI54985.1 GIY-YIG nuclease family protein [Palleronia sp. LCG004]
MSDVQRFRSDALARLTNRIGVYALCDLDARPIYVGQSVDGIRTRVRRHLTSARSDIIANRQIDVWEIGFVWAWPCDDVAQIGPLENAIYVHFDDDLPLMNGKTLETGLFDRSPDWPERQSVQVIDDATLTSRRDPSQRLPRQIEQYRILVDYILNVKEAPHLRRSLNAHFERMVRYHRDFL